MVKVGKYHLFAWKILNSKNLWEVSQVNKESTKVSIMVTKVLVSLYFFLFMLITQKSIAQDEKREYEQSVKKREIPAEILDSLEPFIQKSSRIKYYFQTDGEEETYEIKGRMKGKYYSIEYQKDGTLIDIEMLIDFEEIPENTHNNIQEYLTENYDKYVFTRIQQQYIPEEEEAEEAEEAIEDLMEDDFEDFGIRYELEVDTRAGNQLGSFELLFDAEGKLMQQRKIIKRAEDNIFY